MIPEAILRLIDHLSVPAQVAALVALISGTLVCLYVGSSRKDKSIFRKRLTWGLVVAILAFASILALYHWDRRAYHFPPNVAGILVLQPVGDANRSLQRNLASALNTQLRKVAKDAQIKVHVFPKVVSEDVGSEEAHRQARDFGRQFGAKLVVWGVQAGTKGLHPRITIVEPIPVGQDRIEMPPQNVDEVSLPAELVNAPIRLLNFIVGYSLYERRRYAQAVDYFTRAIDAAVEEDEELHDLYMFRAVCYLNMASIPDRQRRFAEMRKDVESSIEHYRKNPSLKVKLAVAEQSLAHIFLEEHVEPKREDIERAVTLLTDSVKHLRPNKDAHTWAWVQNSLGIAYLKFSKEDKPQSIHLGMCAFSNSLTAFTQTRAPQLWTLVLQNLASAHRVAGENNKAVELRLLSLTGVDEDRDPLLWAMVNLNLAEEYAVLGGHFKEVLERAQNALRVISKEEHSLRWAEAQGFIGQAYFELSREPQEVFKAWERLHKSLGYFHAALEIFAQKPQTYRWAWVQHNVGAVYSHLFKLSNRSMYLEKAKDALTNALTVFTADKYRDYYEASMKSLRMVEDLAKQAAQPGK